MNYGKWVLDCLGLWQEGDYLDELEKNFGTDALDAEEDMLEEIRICMECDRKALGNQVARCIFDQVIERAVDELGMKEEDFEYYCNGSLDTWLRYKGEDIESWAEPENLCEEGGSDEQ